MLIQLAHAFINSRFDYCNPILVGVIRKLQSVLHAAIRLVTGVRGMSTSHQLFVTRSIGYLYGIGSHTRLQRWRLDVFVVRVRHTSLTCVFQLRLLPGRAKLRSARLIEPPTRTKTFGSRSFRSAAPTVWNSLPHIRQSDVSR